ncbi:F-box domain [Macleaya cordata]|uniref:F-box domain n=1 Tax=Macleaya cordata TaxID=56857 RepID=A0A200PSQ5_MACCD|nr:F-box domain [Macleaya cordata]
MSSLPEDIIVDITSRLPVKSILRFRCVCKPWCKLFSGPEFVKMHLKHVVEKKKFNLMITDGGNLYLLDHDSLSSLSFVTKCNKGTAIDYPYKTQNYIVEILGSCNGLVCINPDKYVICIWNPSTKEYKKLPTLEQLEFIPTYLSYRITFGFGYNCNIEDYKLVRITAGSNRSEVMVYSLGSNTWKRIQDIRYNPCYGEQLGVLVNGALHWIASFWMCSKGSIALEVVLVSFDIGNETFKEVPFPEQLNDKKFHKTVGELGGCLCLLSHVYEVVFVDVWVMKDYGVKESWTKLFTIVQSSVTRPSACLRLLQTFENGDILLKRCSKTLISYDLKHERGRVLKIPGIRIRYFKTET